jgi:DNA polymerase (family 10)
MFNPHLVKIFNQIGDLMEIKGEDRFRVNAYRKAARVIDDLSEDVAEIANRGELEQVSGIGKGTAERIMQFIKTGRIDLHDELLGSLPHGILRLLDIPSLGPKKVKQLHDELGIGSMADLDAAIEAGKLESLGGFGAKTVEKIKQGMEFLKTSGDRVPLGVARSMAEPLREKVAGFKGVKRIDIAGSLRRAKETIGDVDLLCEATDGEEVIEAFTALPEVTGVSAKGKTKGSILVANPEGGDFQIDLRVVPNESFGAAMQYFTGSKEHNVRLRERAIKKGYKLNEYGLFEGDTQLAGATEDEIYAKLDLPYIAPELREDRGEIEQAGSLPKLITLDDIKGDMHMHTTASDGRSTIEEMAEAAKTLGYQYIAICEHSRSSAIANGLSIDRLLEHADAIRKVDRKIKGIRLLAGTEVDILADGSLDYPDEVLEQLDWVVASIHAAQGQPREKLTKRTIAAIENPYVNVIGHPSGRLLNRRAAMELQWDEVFKAAARTGTALESSASWQRLDLKDIHVRQAIDAGCVLCINTDAHHTDQLGQMTLGVNNTRRGWATPESVVNTWPLDQLTEWVGRKRS